MTLDTMLQQYNHGEILLSSLANDPKQCECGTTLANGGYRIFGNTLEFSYKCPYCGESVRVEIDTHFCRARKGE